MKMWENNRYWEFIKKYGLAVFYFICFCVLIGAIAGLFYYLQKAGYLERFLQWIDRLGWWGNAILAGAIMLNNIPFIMGTYNLLLLACGLLYGFWMGLLTCFIGSIIGQQVGFWFSKYVFREKIQRLLQSRREIVLFVKLIRQHQIKIALLIRFSPLPPGFQNYALAWSDMKYYYYVATSVVGMTLDQAPTIYLGSQFRDLDSIFHGKLTAQQVVLIALSVCVSLVLAGIFYYFGKKAMEEEDLDENDFLLMEDIEKPLISTKEGTMNYGTGEPHERQMIDEGYINPFAEKNNEVSLKEPPEFAVTPSSTGSGSAAIAAFNQNASSDTSRTMSPAHSFSVLSSPNLAHLAPGGPPKSLSSPNLKPPVPSNIISTGSLESHPALLQFTNNNEDIDFSSLDKFSSNPAPAPSFNEYPAGLSKSEQDENNHTNPFAVVEENPKA